MYKKYYFKHKKPNNTFELYPISSAKNFGSYRPTNPTLQSMYTNHFLSSLSIFGAKYLFIIILVIAFGYFIVQPRFKQKEMLAFGIIALPVMYVILKLGALLYFDARPFVVDHFTPLIPHSPDNGFPSDHTIISAAMASIVYPYSKKISMLLWVLTLLVSASRVYAGIHHPIDIIGSIVIAIVIAYVTYTVILPRVTRLAWYQSIFRPV